MSGTDQPGVAARRLLRRHHYGVLATHSDKFGPYPYASFVDYVTDQQGRPVMLISALAEHTHNIHRHPRVSLAVHDPGPQTQARPRLTLLGEAKLIGKGEAPELVARYLRHFPEAARYLELDFAFYRIEPHHTRFIPGFAQAVWVTPADLLAMGSELAAVEAGIVEHMNTGHRDALAACVRQAQGVPAAQVQMLGIDCDGFDLLADGRLLRIDFDAPVFDAPAARDALAALAQRARGG